MPLTFLLRTFGCKTNQYESQGIRQSFLEVGFLEVDSVPDAQVLIVNTCTVTGKAGANCAYEIRRCLRDNPALRVVVTGCGVDVAESWIEQEAGIEAVFSNSRKDRIANYLLGGAQGHSDVPEGGRFAFSLNGFHGHTRAFIKVQDGCDNFCSYCIIPYARGVPRSRDVEDILQEAERLCAAGYHELVLTGINIGAYHHKDLRLPQLLQKLGQIEGLWRLRMGSVEPVSLDNALLEVVRENPRICPHLHLPLQSGDDRILTAMNRKYTVAEFLEAVARCREVLDNPAITTDVICGFPGEDEESFSRTVQTVLKAAFNRMHIFPYSIRQGTPAAEMKQCDGRVATAHCKTLGSLAREMAAEYAAGFVGRTEDVILEQMQSEGFGGYNSRYMRVVVENPPHELEQGQMVRVAITRSQGAEMFGTLVDILHQP